MRSSHTILNLILDYAERDDTVRAVVRTDLLPVRKYLCSYSFCFIVNDPAKYEDDDIFGSCFGERILLYRADRNYPEMFPGTKAHLMVLRDGITLAIHVMEKNAFLRRYNREQENENAWFGDTYQTFMDKDGILQIPDRLIETQTLFSRTPKKEEFIGACGEFWWVMKSFAEYTLREELSSAMFYLNVAVRDILNKMLRWQIYLRAGHPADMGILDSNLEALLDEDLFALYKKTYPDADYAHIWDAFDAAAELWHKAGTAVAQCCGFDYPSDIEKDMLEFVRNLKKMKQENL